MLRIKKRIILQPRYLSILIPHMFIFDTLIFMKHDHLIKSIAYHGQIRIIAVNSTSVVQEGQTRHHTFPTTSAAFGRSLTAGLLLASTLKGKEKYSIRITGDGDIKEIVIDATAHGTVRGFVHNPSVDFPLNEKGKLDVSRAVGTTGMMTVTKNLGLNQNFSGQVPLVSGEIAEDFTYYLTQSEQIPSSVGLGVLVNPDHSILAAGGFLVQVMPGCKEETLVQVESAISKMPPISTLIKLGKTPLEITEMIANGHPFDVLDTISVRFECTCSKSRTEQTLMLLGKSELEDMVAVHHGADVHCNFCNEHYSFSEADLKKLIVEITAN